MGSMRYGATELPSYRATEPRATELRTRANYASRQQPTRMSQIFLLSPANCGGRRASMVMSERATFDFAAQLRTREGAPLGDVFAFLSGLYFRGKLAYARAFARPPDPESPISGAGSLRHHAERGAALDRHARDARCPARLRARRHRHRQPEIPQTSRAERQGPRERHRPGVLASFCSAASRRPSTSMSCRTSLASGCSSRPTSSAAAT